MFDWEDWKLTKFGVGPIFKKKKKKLFNLELTSYLGCKDALQIEMNDKRCDVIGTQMKHFEKATILTISTQMKRVGKHTKQYQIAVIKSKESRR